MANDLLHWGKHPQLVFESANEYYRALGHLTNSEAYSISYEYNKKNGSYSDACRIHKLSAATNIPQAFMNKLRTNRINCNDYVNNLKENHNFIQSGNVYTRNFDDVFSTVPEEYISDFLIGYKEATEKESGKRVCYIAEAIKTDGKQLSKTEQPAKTGKKANNNRPLKKEKETILCSI